MSAYFMCRHGIFFYKEDSVYYKSRKGRKEVKIQCTMYQTARKSADFMNVRNVAIAFCLYRQ